MLRTWAGAMMVGILALRGVLPAAPDAPCAHGATSAAPATASHHADADAPREDCPHGDTTPCCVAAQCAPHALDAAIMTIADRAPAALVPTLQVGIVSSRIEAPDPPPPRG